MPFSVPSLTALLYRQFLRLPDFRGKARLQGELRSLLFSPAQSLGVHGLRLLLDPLEWAQASLLKDGKIEPETLGLYSRVLRPADVYVDVGAHIGFHTLVARRFVGQAGLVVAVEPQPYNCWRILENWAANGFENLVLHVAVAGPRKELVTLHRQSPTDSSRLSLRLDPVNDQPQTFRVPMVRLDEILGARQQRPVRLLKLDVEGYELDVLEGLGELLGSVENLVLEVLSESDGDTTQALVSRLRAAGFVLMTVHGTPWSPGEALAENNLWASRAMSRVSP